MGHPVIEIKVDRPFRLDLEAMLTACDGAGLVFFNNPEQSDGDRARREDGRRTSSSACGRISPDTVILIDEAYHEYVTDPRTARAMPLAMATPNVFVARTFSKAFGMAGMRIGYAIGGADTVKPLARFKMPYNISVIGIAAAMAALNDPKHIEAERARNTAGARLHGQGARGAGLQVDRVAGQLPLRRRRPAGAGLPRRLREVRA